MVYRYFILLLVLSFHFQVSSQNKSEQILKRASDLFAKNYDASFQLCCQAEKINEIHFIGEVSMCKARYYITFTDYENAEIELGKAISFYKKKNDIVNLSDAYDLKSILLGRLGDSVASGNCLLKAYDLSKKSGDHYSQVIRLTNLSHVFIEFGKLKQAAFYLRELEKLTPYFEKDNFYYLKQNQGAYYYALGNFQKALNHYQKAYLQALKNKMIESEATILMLLSKTYQKLKNYGEAEKMAKKSYQLSQKHHLIYEKSEALDVLISLKEEVKEYDAAFQYQKEFINVEKEILNSEKLNRISAIQNRLVLAEKENIINRQNSKIAKEKLKNTEAELKNQKLYIFLVIISLFLFFLIFIYFRTKKLKDTIQLQKAVVEEKNKLVESQHKDITDSIRYAERIQQAILPPIEQWDNKLPDSFVFYAPKDILSGDFYWIEETEDSIFVAAADCTGHGVPGALISIVNYNLLNKAILEKHIYDPAKILDAVNDWLTDSLHQNYTTSNVKDGMDVSLISINKKTKELYFAGAYNPIYILKDNQLSEIKGDKFPVGAFIHEERSNFTTTSVQLKTGDAIYLFSDGYADQFGGPKGKKFKYSQLKEIILQSQAHTMKQQGIILEESFINWKGQNEQVDDVMILGIRIT